MTLFRKLLFIAVAITGISLSAVARNGFAIVIDPQSYREARAEVDAYAHAIEQQHQLHVYLVEDIWGIPDSIRNALRHLHTQKNTPIVGAVFIGDIPIVMVRDGQHLTSAFKMDQNQPRQKSSVPSDRFYDDFALQFEYLGRDNNAPYFYYSLSATSVQRTRPSIISGRIRPTDANGISRYTKLRAYLQKATAAKLAPRELKQLFYFSGHGYISDSKVARIDEKAAYLEHFPTLGQRTNAISYLDHSDKNPVKERLMNELMRSDLDLAVLHHHGSPTTQYLNGVIRPYTVRDAKAYIMRNMRDHIYAAHKRGRNSDSLQSALLARFDVPNSWVEHALSDSVARLDSAYAAASDLHIEDFTGYNYLPNTPVVVIDACFCGSFHRDNCIANAYIFQPGGTIAVIANSVNVLQDKWSDRFIGLLNQGGSVGDLVRYAAYLESHCIGDPTYRFANTTPNIDLHALLLKGKASDWRKLLVKGTPDQQSVAIEQLHRLKLLTRRDLLNIYQSSPYGIVRLQALTALGEYGGDEYIAALILASQDAYELAQRIAVRRMGSSGDERLIPALIKLAIANNTSARVTFDVGMSIASFPQDKILAEFTRQFDNPVINYVRKDSIRKHIEHALKTYTNRVSIDLENALRAETPIKDRKLAIRASRNVMVHHLVPQLINFVETQTDEATQLLILEALGWHPTSVQAENIRASCLRISKDKRYSVAVRTEALKTYNRLR
ncbi:MAG: C25 family cysteine peptidase [Bacteroidales bacterium]|nr:C25 family cysteine peptidase [Bacteroidales bacterium]